MRHYCLDWPDLPADAFRRAPGKNRPLTLEGGGKGGGSAPSYPDPNVVAQATTNTNEASAAYNKSLNLNNYSNPFGSQQSVQVGTDPTTGAPIYNTSISANPQLQGQLSNLLGQTGNSGAINQSALTGLSSLGSQAQNIEGNYGNLMGGMSSLMPQYQNVEGALGNEETATSGLAGGYSGLNQQLAGLGGQINAQTAQQAQQAGTNAAYASSMGYLQPQFNQQQQSTAAQLANQGLQAGSQAWNNAETNLSQNQGMQQQQALNNAQLTGSQIGTQNLQNQISGINTQAGLIGQQGSNLTSAGGLYGLAGNLANSQLNSLNSQAGVYGQQGNLAAGQLGTLNTQAGLYGQQVGVGQTPYSNLGTIAQMIPGYSGTSQSAASPADIAGLYNNQYQSQLAGYNAGQSSSNNMMSGLFGLGSAGIMGMMMSDRRAKRDIRRIGTWDNGLGVYTYRYAWEKSGRHIGFMADEVREVAPAAVVRGNDGYDRVSYVLAVR